MAAAKVVRVEDVEECLSLTSPPPAIFSAGDASHQILDRKSSSEVSQDHHSDGSGKSDLTGLEEDVEEEAKEKVYPLPDDWPRIKRLERPMSCALSTSRMPCVRKAVSHLELIQNIIDEWFKRAVSVAKSRSSSRSASSESVPEAPKKQLRFRDPSTRSTTAASGSSMAKTSRTSSAATLSVNGIGAETPVMVTPAEEDSEELGLEIPYLGAEDVIEEVITLLARLELDRQTTMDRFQKEMDIAITLKKKIDDLCLRRLRELPELVQREHEACIVDLNELQWHLAYTARTQIKSQQRKDNAQLINTRLHEDIEFVKMHVPLVEEKLVLELQAMDRIKKAQVETNQELMTTKQRQAKTEQKSTEALSKAETERGHIRRELDNVRDNLTQISEELSTAKMTFNSYVHQVTDIGHQLTDNASELDVLAVKDTNAQAAEEMQASKVRNLQSKITDAEFEYRRLENANEQSEEELKVMERKNSSYLEDLTQKAKALESKLRVITRRNNELTMDIEDTTEKINRCYHQKIADEKNIRRIHREIERVATMMQATMEEHSSVATINHHIKDQLHSEQEKAYRTEESLKNTAETLRRQVKEEVHTRTVMQARITSDTAEIEKTRSESGKKKEKADKVASDVDLAVTVVLDKVEKLRSAKKRRDEQKVQLRTQIEETREQLAKSQKEFEKRLNVLTPHYNVLKIKLDELKESILSRSSSLSLSTDEVFIAGKEVGISFSSSEEESDDSKLISFAGYDEVLGKEEEGLPPEKREALREERAARKEKKLEKIRKRRNTLFPPMRSRREMDEDNEVYVKPTIVHFSSSESDSLPQKLKLPGQRLRKAITDEAVKVEPPPPPLFIRILQDEVGKLDKVLGHMSHKTDLMNKKIEEMDGAQSMMDKVSAKTQAALKELYDELEELNKQLEAARKIGDDLKTQLTAVNDRLKDGEGRHYRLMQDRCAVLLKQEDDKVGGLKKNKDLAARYRQLQNEFLVKKEQLLRTFDDRLKLETTINDVKQLRSLQSKMHGALAEYFKLSGLFNEGELTRLEQVSSENGMRVGQLQGDMEEALSLITSFLQTEMDGTKARQMAWEAVKNMSVPNGAGAGAGAAAPAGGTPPVMAS